MQLHEITWLLTIFILILINLNDEVLTKKSVSEGTKKSNQDKTQTPNKKQSKTGQKDSHQLRHSKKKNVEKGHHGKKNNVSHRQGLAISKVLQSVRCPPTRIIGGGYHTDGQMPYTAIYYLCPKPITHPVSTKGCDQWCGGSIISHYHILTAAHCLSENNYVASPNKVLARVGFHDLRKPETNATTLEVSAIFIHKDYRQRPIVNDIALIKLKNAILFTKLVQPICINGPHYDYNYKKLSAIVSGWGKTAQNSPNSKELKYALLTIYSYPKCNVDAKQSLLQFCAHSSSTKDGYICNGDSGSGLLYFDNNTPKNTLLGIASTAGKIVHNQHICGNPMTFVNVSSYAQWINEHAAL